ncbi:hypothetical protein I302_101032 [Kwoniella bestiolae CBS 10118]|uniref:DASH complex subunit ASK1 n=1 Tax=Kwoniella bestiolae CBS 10118 TaxID=1296100 RepID=A0A1B9G6V3_9TREE|nr:hypothetical protein I302_04408 [Kwoniella bestiolae CBS 10118]OCF26721.1 hypothetical protein I302_04408 [Kwoniella bestiolae CBS 10118]
MSNPNSNPLLSPPFYVIPGIDPNSPISAQTEQIDQLNTLLLQEIDANFAKFHQTVTSRILPEIKRFAIAGEPTREAAQFWRSFFEAASSIRTTGLEEPSLPSHQDTSTQYDDQTMTLRREHDESGISQDDQSGSSFIFDPPATSSTPLPNAAKGKGRINESWEDSMESPFDRLDRRLRDDLKIGPSAGKGDGMGMDFINNQSGISSDLPTPSLPSGYSLPHLGSGSNTSPSLPSINWNQSQDQSSQDYSTGTVDPQEIHHAQQPGQHSRPSSATPKANKVASSSSTISHNPFGPNFDGIVDLRSTPLNSKQSKRTKKPPKQSILPGIDDESSDEELPFGMSPPVTMKFSLPPKAKAIFDMSRTPGKKAVPRESTITGTNDNVSGIEGKVDQEGEKQAKYILDDLLEEMGSELSPRLDTPEGLGRYSIMPGELQAGEGRLLFSDQQQQRQPVLEEQEEEEEDQTYHPSSYRSVGESHNPTRERLHRRSTGANTSYGSDMVDLPVGQVYSAEDSFDNEDSFASDLDDGYDNPTATGTGTATGTISSVPYSTHDHILADDSYLSSEGDLTTTSEAGAIFGKQPNYLPQPQSHQHRQSTLAGVGGGGPRRSHFNLMKMDEMDTYHGGRLEDAAGHDVENSPTKGLARGR